MSRGQPARELTPIVRKEPAMKDDIVIVSATRTPVGAFNGAFAIVTRPRIG